MLLTVTDVVALSVTNMQQYVVEVGLTELNNALPPVKEDKVWTKVDPVLQVEVVDEYSLAVQSGVPLDHAELKVTDCPEFIVGFEGIIDGIVRAVLTVNAELYIEFIVVGCESVTTTLNTNGLFAASAPTEVYSNVLLADDTPVKSMFATTESVMLFEISQLQVYGATPPDTVIVHDTVCPASSIGDDGQEDRVGVDRGVQVIVKIPDFTEFAVSGE